MVDRGGGALMQHLPGSGRMDIENILRHDRLVIDDEGDDARISFSTVCGHIDDLFGRGIQRWNYNKRELQSIIEEYVQGEKEGLDENEKGSVLWKLALLNRECLSGIVSYGGDFLQQGK